MDVVVKPKLLSPLQRVLRIHEAWLNVKTKMTLLVTRMMLSVTVRNCRSDSPGSLQ